MTTSVKNIENYFLGMAKAYPALIIFSGIIYSLLGENYTGIMISLFQIINDILNVFVFKNISQKLFNTWYPDNNTNNNCNSSLLRPPHDHSCAVFDTCDIITKTGNCLTDRKIGMPSGHAQGGTAIALILILLIVAQKNSSNWWKIGSSLIIIGITLFVIISRVVIKCHTWLQVIIGSFIGYLLGLLYYYFIKWWDPLMFEDIPDTWHYFTLFGPPTLYILLIIFLSI